MKFILVWVCLIIYLNAAVSPVLPWVVDVCAHAFMWKDHYEHVHNGHKHSHHVMIEITAQQDDKNSHSPAAPSRVLAKDILTAHVVPLEPYKLAFLFEGTACSQLNANWTFNYKNVFSSIFLPPPKVAA